MSAAWRLIDLAAPEDPVWNMAFDTALLEGPSSAVPTLRFYQWSRPAVSVGYFQNVDAAVQANDAARTRTVVVRRPTGGGSVPHGRDLTLSLSLPETDPRMAGGVSDSYRTVHSVILKALRPMFDGLSFTSCASGLNARGKNERVCFEEPVSCDLEWRGKKAVGSSQRRKNGRILHQTSVQLPGDGAEAARRIAEAFGTEWGVRWERSAPLPDEIVRAKTAVKDLYVSGEWSFDPAL